MKKALPILFFISFSTFLFSQSNNDIAKVYVKKARNAIETSIDFKTALENFEKAMKYMDTITDKKVASLGASIYFEEHNKRDSDLEKLEFLKKSESYSKQYFLLNNNKSTEEFSNNVENFVLIQETIINLNNKIKKSEEDRLRKEKELKKIDSLKTIWKSKSETLSIKADSIYAFNKKNIALYNDNGNFGVINDKGNVIIKANDDYKAVKEFGGYFLFMNKKENPTKIYCFNIDNNKGFIIPNISDFNPLSTHYGQVMLPRENGRLVTYPDNSFNVFVFDIPSRKVVQIANLKNLLKNLKKSDKIDKYDYDESTVKINKVWYNFGGHIGGGVHPLFNDDYSIYGYLCSIDGTILTKERYNYIGAFDANKLQAIKDKETFWINQNGTEVSPAKHITNGYIGKSKISKLPSGNYQIKQDGIIILEDKKLEKLADFLRTNKKE